MIVVYAHNYTPRLHYVIYFLSLYYGQSIDLFDLEKIDEEAVPKADVYITYTDKPRPGTIHIKPHGLLSESSIRPVPIVCHDHQNGYKAFFKTDDDLGFDLFAAIFYLLSRYEEYLPHEKDEYGRYAYTNSLAYQNGFLHLPLIDIWLEDFRKRLQDAELPSRRFSFLPTYDIDSAWSFRHKGWLRNAGGLIKSIINGQWSVAKDRMDTLTGKVADPFDCFEWLDDLHKECALQPLYFFLVSKTRTTYDKNISPTNRAFKKLIKSISKQYKIGVHPSWNSGDRHELLLEEKRYLERVIGVPVHTSRQHYIRFTVPETFRHLMAAGITEDYSMGYGSINGFRASTASSFPWYDLEKEAQSGPWIHPFCFMDANAYYEQKLTPKQAYDELLHYYNEVKKVSGTMITIWHNSILGTAPEFGGLREVYQQFVGEVISSK